MRYSLIKVSLFLFFLLGLNPNSLAAPKKVEPAKKETSTFKEIEKQAIKTNIEISEKLDDLAERLDLFLAGGKVTEEKNDTQLSLISYTEWIESGRVSSTGHVDFSLRLPNLEEFWQLKFTTVEPNEFQSLDQKRPGLSSGRRKYVASLGFIDRLGKFKTTFRPRIQLSNPLETSYLLQFSNAVKMKWLMFRPEFKFFADSEQGTGQSAAFPFDFELNKKWVLRYIIEEQYLDLLGQFSTNIGLQLMWAVNDKVGLTTALTGYSTNRPVYHLEKYLYLISLRHEVYKKILYYQLTPLLTFDKDHSFKGRSGLAFNLEIIF